jgi:hypothetical protein
MRELPINAQGFPVPWFVAVINGTPDFRVIDRAKLRTAVLFQRCWLCGGHLGRTHTYVIGPMCMVNRISSEPPSHFECADFAARACPFLTQPDRVYREKHLPTNTQEAAGFASKRNPGVAVLWTTREPLHVFRAHAGKEGMLFRLGEPMMLAYYTEGRMATRPEIDAALEGGCEVLRATAAAEGQVALRLLATQIERARGLLPA